MSIKLKTRIKKIVNTFLKSFNFEIKSTRPILTWEQDADFNFIYNLAQHKTQMAFSDNPLRRQRHYILIQYFRTLGLPKNAVVECGVWRGLSSYQLCYHLKKYHDQGLSVEYHVFDSFEGLSRPTHEDIPTADNVKSAKKGKLNCSIQELKRNLSEFSFITYHKGWIPEKFHEVKHKKFSFVHIDVDLYQPIKDSIEFFYTRIDRNGLIIIDDYGYLQFPGAFKAVEEFVSKEKCPCLRLPTGQAIIFKGNRT